MYLGSIESNSIITGGAHKIWIDFYRIPVQSHRAGEGAHRALNLIYLGLTESNSIIIGGVPNIDRYL